MPAPSQSLSCSCMCGCSWLSFSVRYIWSTPSHLHSTIPHAAKAFNRSYDTEECRQQLVHVPADRSGRQTQMHLRLDTHGQPTHACHAHNYILECCAVPTGSFAPSVCVVQMAGHVGSLFHTGCAPATAHSTPIRSII